MVAEWLVGDWFWDVEGGRLGNLWVDLRGALESHVCLPLSKFNCSEVFNHGTGCIRGDCKVEKVPRERNARRFPVTLKSRRFPVDCSKPNT